ncbi:hypothetical protein [Roseateles sp. DAIF2]|uniref:hypothetical protein n=1 Tax=Roseateles sp. DAIF2 TaxID=2714952 RepID=UPI0018A25E60|nr:hypothetical protein [Roseateles sp. DAIF2]
MVGEHRLAEQVLLLALRIARQAEGQHLAARRQRQEARPGQQMQHPFEAAALGDRAQQRQHEGARAAFADRQLQHRPCGRRGAHPMGGGRSP